jgi:hypothetical protein
MATKVIWENKSQHLKVSIQGQISGEAILPSFSGELFSEAIFDLTGVKYINSEGIRNWIIWLNEIKRTHPTAKFTFENVHHLLVRQAYSIKGFFPPSSYVESFILPYFCSSCDYTFELTIQKKKNIDSNMSKEDRSAKISHSICTKCERLVPLDAVLDHYLWI